MTKDPMTSAHERDEVGRRLTAYGRGLSPDPHRMRAIRAELVARAASEAAGTWIRPSPALAPPGQVGWFRRRLAAGGLAAGLGLACLTGGAVASAPGGPLYGARLWVETLALPSDATSRVVAVEGRLDARLAEATEAAQAGNDAALRAALGAYSRLIDDLLVMTGLDVDRDAQVASALDRQEEVLSGLLNRVPGSAAVALQRVLDRTQGTIQRLGGPDEGTRGAGHDRGNHPGDQPSDGGHHGGDGSSETPVQSSRPDGTPQPSGPSSSESPDEAPASPSPEATAADHGRVESPAPSLSHPSTDGPIPPTSPPHTPGG